MGEGQTFKGKLIGVLEVEEARGDRMCQDALQELKTAVRASGEHKQRIIIHVAVDGLKIRDEKSGVSLRVFVSERFTVRTTYNLCDLRIVCTTIPFTKSASSPKTLLTIVPLDTSMVHRKTVTDFSESRRKKRPDKYAVSHFSTVCT